LLLTILIKVNVLVSDRSRVKTTGDDHEVQKGEREPRAPQLASWPWLERRWRQRLIEIRPFRPDFRGNLTICGSARIVFLRLRCRLAHGRSACRMPGAEAA